MGGTKEIRVTQQEFGSDPGGCLDQLDSDTALLVVDEDGVVRMRITMPVLEDEEPT